MTRCPVCGEEKERIAQHWAMSSCGYPEIPPEKRRIVDGLVLGGATVAGSGNNRHLTLGSTNSELIGWLTESLDWLCHGVRRDPGRDGRDAVLRCRTPAHPGLNRYERWGHIGEQAGRAPPDDFTLRPLAGRIWWALAGGLQWSGDHDTQRQGTVSAEAPKKAEWVQRVLDDAGFDSVRVGTRVQLAPTSVSAWLAWIGRPLPGVTHKWARTQPEYRQLITGEKDSLVGMPIRWDRDRCVAALRFVAETADRPLTREIYIDVADTARRELPSIWTIYENEAAAFESWAEACEAAGVAFHRTEWPEPVVLRVAREWVTERLRGSSAPTMWDYQVSATGDPTLPSHVTLYSYIDSWSEFVEQCREEA